MAYSTTIIWPFGLFNFALHWQAAQASALPLFGMQIGQATIVISLRLENPRIAAFFPFPVPFSCCICNFVGNAVGCHNVSRTNIVSFERIGLNVKSLALFPISCYPYSFKSQLLFNEGSRFQLHPALTAGCWAASFQRNCRRWSGRVISQSHAPLQSIFYLQSLQLFRK